MKFKSIDLKIAKNKDINFILSKFNLESNFTNTIKEKIEGIDLSFYLLSEIKGTLDIEGDGSSRKIINELIKGKKAPQNENEQKAINLHAAIDFINTAKPNIDKVNLMLIYNMLNQKIDMKDNTLEHPFDYRQSKDEGFIGRKNFKTPTLENLNKGMADLIDFINSDLLDETPIEKALIIQIIFIYFHPFYDFNGRTGRLLSYWYLTLMNENEVKNIIYLSLPEYKKQYVWIWEAFRRGNWNDLTSFMNWLGEVTLYGAHKLEIVNKLVEQKEYKANETELVILFYLMEYHSWVSVNDFTKKIDLGISKAGIFKAINKLNDVNLLNLKIQKNVMYILPKKIIHKDDLPHHTRLFKEIMENPSRQDLTFMEIHEKEN